MITGKGKYCNHSSMAVLHTQRLYAQGLRPKEIVRRLREDYSIDVSEGTVRSWERPETPEEEAKHLRMVERAIELKLRAGLNYRGVRDMLNYEFDEDFTIDHVRHVFQRRSPYRYSRRTRL